MVRFKVIITEPVSRRLQQVYGYIERDSPDNASSMIAELVQAIDSLVEMPSRATVAGTSRSRRSLIHRLPVGSYLIYFRVDDVPREVVIVEVRHGAQRQPRRFE